jgi:hypothetical protein
MSVVGVVCCKVEASAKGRSLPWRSPTECGVSRCDRGTSTMRRPGPTWVAEPWEEKKSYFIKLCLNAIGNKKWTDKY